MIRGATSRIGISLKGSTCEFMSLSIPENAEQDHVMVRCCGDAKTVAYGGERLTCVVCGAVFEVRKSAARAF